MEIRKGIFGLVGKRVRPLFGGGGDGSSSDRKLERQEATPLSVPSVRPSGGGGRQSQFQRQMRGPKS